MKKYIGNYSFLMTVLQTHYYFVTLTIEMIVCGN